MGAQTSIECEVTDAQRRALCFEVEKWPSQMKLKSVGLPVDGNYTLDHLRHLAAIQNMQNSLNPVSTRMTDPMHLSALLVALRRTGVHLMMEPKDVYALQYGMYGHMPEEQKNDDGSIYSYIWGS